MKYKNDSCSFGCSIEAAIGAIGGKRKGLILYHLSETKRFNELQKAIPAITQRMLTKQLRELESDGIISRKIYPQVPPKVEYSLTEFGQTLQPVLASLEAWGNKYLSKFETIRNSQ